MHSCPVHLSTRYWTGYACIKIIVKRAYYSHIGRYVKYYTAERPN